MNVLALELSTATGSIASISDSEVSRRFPNDRKHSGAFFENLREVHEQTGTPECIVVGLGPGSYAGVRIAIAAAVGLTKALGSPLIGIPSIAGIETDDHDDYYVIGDARRDSYFFARVTGREIVEGPSLCTVEALQERLTSDPGLPVFTSAPLAGFPDAVIAYPSALELARLARREQWPSASEKPLEPIYLRAPHITSPRANTAGLVR